MDQKESKEQRPEDRAAGLPTVGTDIPDVWGARKLPKKSKLQSRFEALGRPFPLTLVSWRQQRLFPARESQPESLSEKQAETRKTESPWRGTRSTAQLQPQVKGLESRSGGCEGEMQLLPLRDRLQQVSLQLHYLWEQFKNMRFKDYGFAFLSKTQTAPSIYIEHKFIKP